MQRTNDGMTASLPPEIIWQKSHYSNPCGSCVELAQLADGRIAVRNSRYPGGPTLVSSRTAVAAFIHSAKMDEFMAGDSMA